jgi:adenylate cyclase
VANALDQPIVVSDELAQVLGGEVVSLGRHQLRGLATPRELFAQPSDRRFRPRSRRSLMTT